MQLDRPHLIQAAFRSVQDSENTSYLLSRYLHDGVFRMCVYCRRVEAVGANARWDWVPTYVATMPMNVSHGLCPLCDVFHASTLVDP